MNNKLKWKFAWYPMKTEDYGWAWLVWVLDLENGKLEYWFGQW